MDNTNNLPPQDSLEEIHLSDYIAVLYRRRRLALLAFFAVAIAVGLYTFLVAPVYEATSTLHVRSDKVKGGDFLAEMGLSRENPVETEIEIVKARTNMEEVVRRLRLNWVMDKKSPGMELRLVEFTSSAEEPVYHIRVTSAGFEVTDGNGRVYAAGRPGTLVRGEDFTLLVDELKGLPGDSLRLTLASYNRTVQDLRNAVRASEIGRGTSIIRVSYQHTDPQVARDVVNTLAQVYLERNVAVKAQEASRSVEFISGQLNSVRATLDDAEQELQQYKSDTGVVRLDAEAESLIQRATDAERRLAALSLRRHQAEFALDALQSAINRKESYAPAILLDEPVVAALAGNLAALEVERRGLMVEFSALHPAVVSLQDRISETQVRLVESYRTILSGLREGGDTLQAELNRYEEALRRLPAAELELARLTRRATVNAGIYTFLLQKNEEARIAQAATLSSINVIDPAIAPDLPVKPQKKKNLLLGFVVGGMLGVGLAFFREYLDDTIKDADTAKRLLGLPVLAVIPLIGRREDLAKGQDGLPPARILISSLDPRSAAAEAFRALRTGLHFAGVGKKNQVLLITSTLPGEGKTVVSGNLAHSMAQTGSRVVIVGCDLRKPTLHQMFGGENKPGLTEVLIGDATLDAAIKPTDLPSLHYISAGTIPPNPAELLGSERMGEIVAELRRRYDTVLLDAPPILAVTDAAVLTHLADRSLVVLHAGAVGAKPAQRMLEVLRSTKTPLAGMVLNDRTGAAAEYYGGRYYGQGSYAYTYGYGAEHEQKKRGLLARLLGRK